MKIGTKCVQEGWIPGDGEPRVLPIYQSTTFKYETSESMGDLFDLKKPGYFYTRLANPTSGYVEKKLTELEGGVGCMLTSSGQAANLAAVLNIAKAGDHIVSSSSIYGGTFNLIAVSIKKMGIETTFIDPTSDYETICKAIRPNTRLIFGETLANPALTVLDIETFAKAAHDNNIPLIVDNTFPTPINCRPFEFGADIVTHAATKYMDGHGTIVMGAVIDSGNFDWHKGNFPELTEPDESYHGLVYTEAFGKNAYINKCVTGVMRDLGLSPSPFNSFLLNMGLETLHLRMKKHNENGLKIAQYLENHPKIDWVSYPGLKSSPFYDLAQKYMPNGQSGVISVGIKGGKENALKTINNFKLIAIVTHVATLSSCCLHPATSTHRQLSDEQLKACGVPPELIRISIGIEEPEDIIADLEQALALI